MRIRMVLAIAIMLRFWRRKSPESCTIMTSVKTEFNAHLQSVLLPPEDPFGTELKHKTLETPKFLHYNPLNNKEIVKRSSLILKTILEKKIELVIVDVSVEIATLCRVSSVPYAYVRLMGNRNDLAHTEAFRGATFLIAYFPEWMESPEVPNWVKNKTLYMGFVSKPSKTDVSKENFLQELNFTDSKPILSVIKGFGGSDDIDEKLPEIRQMFPHHFIISVGPISNEYLGFVDVNRGLVSNVNPFLAHSDLVIGACGSNLVAEILHFDTPFIAIPSERPFDEQKQLAESLERMRLAKTYQPDLKIEEIPKRDDGIKSLVEQNSLEKFAKLCESSKDIHELFKLLCSHQLICLETKKRKTVESELDLEVNPTYELCI